MTKTELSNILEKHKKWLNGESDGKMAIFYKADLRGMNLHEVDFYMANLYEADLRGADLSGANLNGANLYGADISRANLDGANLYGADIREANLYRANLHMTDLSGANLYGANIRMANLRGANLYGANLHMADARGANFYRANLYVANLYGANLYMANLSEANLYGANLYKANLYGALNIPDYVYPINCPQEGSFIGFKKAHVIIGTGKLRQNVIVKLRVTDDAKRNSATTRKCRCSKAEVISITSLDGNIEFKEAYSNHDKTFVYKTGEIVSVDDFDEDRWNECSTGIHFFITREEAVDY